MVSSFLVTIFIIFVLVLLVAGTYVSLTRKNNTIKNAWQLLDTQARRRYDLIPFLIEIIRRYNEEEDPMLVEMEDLLATAKKITTVEERAVLESDITYSLQEIFEEYQNFPELINDENYKELEFQLSDIEGKIQSAQTYYNENVYEFNELIKVFPIVYIADYLSMREKEPFNYAGETENYDEEYEPDEEDTLDENVDEAYYGDEEELI